MRKHRGNAKSLRAAALVWPALALALSGCGHVGRRRAFPLYPNPERPRPPGTLAELQGPVGTVDGVDVEPYGTTFALLPGCHVVTLRRRIGQGDASGGAWAAELGTMTYALRMRPGYRYSIDFDVRFRSAPHGTMTITANEWDASDRLVAQFPRVRGDADIEACEEWAGWAPPSLPELP